MKIKQYNNSYVNFNGQFKRTEGIENILNSPDTTVQEMNNFKNILSAMSKVDDNMEYWVDEKSGHTSINNGSDTAYYLYYFLYSKNINDDNPKICCTDSGKLSNVLSSFNNELSEIYKDVLDKSKTKKSLKKEILNLMV